MKNKPNSFGTTALVLGIIGVIRAWIPVINNLSFIFGLIAVIFELVTFFKNKKNKASIALN